MRSLKIVNSNALNSLYQSIDFLTKLSKLLLSTYFFAFLHIDKAIEYKRNEEMHMRVSKKKMRRRERSSRKQEEREIERFYCGITLFMFPHAQNVGILSIFCNLNG